MDGGSDLGMDNMPVDDVIDGPVLSGGGDTVHFHNSFDFPLQFLGGHLLLGVCQAVQGEDQLSRVLGVLQILEHLAGNLRGLQNLGDFLSSPGVVNLFDGDLFLVLDLHFVDLMQDLLDVSLSVH
jgi:hypothetical protein